MLLNSGVYMMCDENQLKKQRSNGKCLKENETRNFTFYQEHC